MLPTVDTQGTRSALYANDRESITVTVQEVTPKSVGALVALYERAVGIYASLVNINAYHQPGKMSHSPHADLFFHNFLWICNLILTTLQELKLEKKQQEKF